MASVNKWIGIGNLGRDPESRYTSSGEAICNFSIACTETWKDKQTGERKERTEWHSVVLSSDGLVGVAERYLKKGSKVYIEGQLKTRKWQDASGQDRYTTEISVGGMNGVLTMLDGPSGNAGGNQRREPDGSQGAPTPPADDLDDDIPFMTNRGIW